MTQSQNIGLIILRLALAFVFLWFGFSQISDAAIWTSFVPDWATIIAPAGTLVLLNGLLEIIAGSMLAFGLFSRYVSFLLGIHLFIIAVSFGLTAIGVRDIGLALATFALSFIGNDNLAISYYFKTFWSTGTTQ